MHGGGRARSSRVIYRYGSRCQDAAERIVMAGSLLGCAINWLRTETSEHVHLIRDLLSVFDLQEILQIF